MLGRARGSGVPEGEPVMPIPVDLDSIRDAAAIIRGAVVRTPTVESPSLSLLLGCRLSLKLETQQHTNSFKERGAVVKLSGLDSAARRQGVIAMSAGNPAQRSEEPRGGKAGDGTCRSWWSP